MTKIQGYIIIILLVITAGATVINTTVSYSNTKQTNKKSKPSPSVSPANQTYKDK